MNLQKIQTILNWQNLAKGALALASAGVMLMLS